MIGWDEDRGLGALLAPHPQTINPDAKVWNTFGVNGVDNQGFIEPGAVLVCNTEKAYNEFKADGWREAEIPDGYVKGNGDG